MALHPASSGGRIGIFNRSYYEDVPIPRVRPELVSGGRDTSASPQDGSWSDRYDSINDLERHLTRNGTQIIKLFLHLSKEEQRRRFLPRIEESKKNWKFSRADVAERKFWDHYMKAYALCLSATSTRDVPWFLIPANDKENARLIVSHLVLATLDDMDLHYPQASPERLAEPQAIGNEPARLIC